jgi:hypothetical protein
MSPIIQINQDFKRIESILGVPSLTTVKVERVSRNIFEQLFHLIRQGFCSFLGLGLQEKKEFFALAHAVKNHGFMHQAEFFALLEGYELGSKESIHVLKGITKRVFDDRLIDRRHLFKLMLMIDNGDTQLALGYLAGLSCIQHLNKFQADLKEIVTHSEFEKLLEMLKYTYDKGNFQETDIQLLTTLQARLEIYQWAKGRNPLNVSLLQAIKTNNEAQFSQELTKEIGLNFSSFVEFNNSQKSLSYLQGLYKELNDFEGDLSPLKNRYDFFLQKESAFIPHQLLNQTLAALNEAFARAERKANIPLLINNFFKEKPTTFHQGLKQLGDTLSQMSVPEIKTFKIEQSIVLDSDLKWVELKQHDPKRSLFTV